MNKAQTAGLEKVQKLFDAGTFVELGAHIRRPGCPDRYEAVICGYGAIGGKLVFAFVEDSGRAKGAFDDTAAAKICELYGAALRNGAPVIGIFDSAGAVVTDGSRVLSAYGKVMKAATQAKARIPQIAVVSGVCSGMSAMIASLADITVGVCDGGEFYIGNSAKVEETFKKGGLDLIVDNFGSAAKELGKLIDLLPANSQSGSADLCDDDAGRPIDTQADPVSEIADGKKILDLYCGYAGEVRVDLAKLGGYSSVIVSACGELTPAGAKKATKAVKLANAFGMPLITLVDSTGVSGECAKSYASLAKAYANAVCPLITVITGRAYGAVFTLMGSKALGADMVYACEGAYISTMKPEAAVAFLWNDQITQDTTRSQLEGKWLDECASCELAAANGDIDDIISPEELRARICSAVFMLSEKSAGIPKRRGDLN